jgi:hypothetical protein
MTTVSFSKSTQQAVERTLGDFAEEALLPPRRTLPRVVINRHVTLRVPARITPP